ncbi:E3 ubiquitin-protein ligase MARCH3 [Cottoperca gobio]|uniref:E3 ubiquitin-protein ligase MARCH3 n=1 Tax=Cottoperca gobio TaxID=56716 RepID=A0A6J2PBS5_COTGO|nr:E3 ubiquitin-protein ligase MARCH3-like [Cottoperca gobio]
MAPYRADMTAEELLSPWVYSPVGEVKLMSEHGLEKELNRCNQEVTHHADMATEECTAITDSLCSEEPFCRICHEGRASGELLSLCKCSGSLAMVHRTYLEHWLTASNSSHCKLCHHQFTVERLPKPLTEPSPSSFSQWLCSSSMQQQRRTLCGDAVCFLFITPLASLSGWLCVHGAMDLYYTNGMEALGLLVLTLALFTIYVFWTVVRSGCILFNTWKKTDQRVRLQIPSSAHNTSNLQTRSINTHGKATNKETMV